MPTSGCWSMVKYVFRPGDQSQQRRYSILIPLGKDDRFLTLAATDGGDGNDWDWPCSAIRDWSCRSRPTPWGRQ